MSVLGQLNLNYLRIFMAVYRTKSMTLAAKELHLTQSGISQQIKALESALNAPLFDRVNRRIIPTERAEILFNYCSEGIQELERILEGIGADNPKPTLKGTVRIGFPPVFGYHVLIPLLARFLRENPQVTFELRMGLALEVTPLLLDGRLDFAFIDAFAKDSHLVATEVRKEFLLLCCHKNIISTYGKPTNDVEYFRKLPFIAYLQGEPILRSWFRHHFNSVPNELNIIATIFDSFAIARMIDEGMAAGLLPEILANDLREKNPLIQVFDTKTKVANIIHLCHLSKRTLGLAASKCFNDLTNWLNDES